MNKHIFIKFVLALALLVGVFVASWLAVPKQDHFLISMMRVPCFGECPIYSLVIYSDGTVYYEGYAHVRTVGKASKRLRPDQVLRLVREIRNSGIFDKNAGCCRSRIKDVAFVNIEITLNGAASLAFYPLDSSNVIPPELRHLECVIDQVTNSEQWTGRLNDYCKNILN